MLQRLLTFLRHTILQWVVGLILLGVNCIPSEQHLFDAESNTVLRQYGFPFVFHIAPGENRQGIKVETAADGSFDIEERGGAWQGSIKVAQPTNYANAVGDLLFALLIVSVAGWYQKRLNG
jgi:hypothetical protein